MVHATTADAGAQFSGLSRTSAASGSLLAESSRAGFGAAAVEDEITPADKAAFQQALTDIQTAWSQQDLAGLRRLVTPEMLDYFSTGLAEQASEGVANRVEEVVLGRAEVRESWSEGATQYATVSLGWSARDYTISLAKQPGEPGYIVEGNAELPVETTEVWTFMRFGAGSGSCQPFSRCHSGMLKQPASFVLTSFRGSTYGTSRAHLFPRCGLAGPDF